MSVLRVRHDGYSVAWIEVEIGPRCIVQRIAGDRRHRPDLCAIPSPAPATVERSAKGASAKNIRVGVYLNVQPDCSSGALPAIRLVNPPSNGTVSIKRGKVTATNYKQCLALEVPGFIAFYQSKPDFAGTDVVTLEIKYPEGRTELQRITINVGSSGAPGAAGQKI